MLTWNMLKKQLLLLPLIGIFLTALFLAPRFFNPTWHLEGEAAVLWFGDNPKTVSVPFLRLLKELSIEQWADPKIGDHFRWRFGAPNAPDTIQSILSACGGPEGARATFQKGIGVYRVCIERFGTIIQRKTDRWRWQVFMMLPDENGNIKKVNVKDEALARRIASPFLGERKIEKGGALAS